MKVLRKSFEEIAEELVTIVPERGDELDFSEASLQVVQELIEWAASNIAEISEDDQRRIVEGFGCYVLEVARRTFGGRYAWDRPTEQPVLVIGEPERSVGMMAWSKVEGRLNGDEGDNIPIFFAIVAERVRANVPGDNVYYF